MWQWLYFWRFCPGRILSREDFVPGGFCPLPMHFNGLLDDLWHFEHFFSRGGFCPGGGFCPLHILSITTYILMWQWLYFWGFCPGRILSQENFVLYLFTLMVSLMTYGIIEYFFFPGRILSSAYSLHYYLHSIVAMIIFLRILSWEDFVLGGFCPGSILSWEDFVLGGFCPLPMHFNCFMAF